MKQPILVTGGAGYIGLPLAVEFGKKYRTIGFDIKQSRIDELNAGHDGTREVEPAELRFALVCHPEAPNDCHPESFASLEDKLREGSHRLQFTSIASDLAACNVFIVTVPTPVDGPKRPDLSTARQGLGNRRQGHAPGRGRYLRIHRLPMTISNERHPVPS